MNGMLLFAGFCSNQGRYVRVSLDAALVIIMKSKGLEGKVTKERNDQGVLTL